MVYDVAIVGAGPAGACCAATCAAAGLRTLLLERAVFPREKVCGDCINPACWPVLDRLGISDRLRALPHSVLKEVEFIGLNNVSVRVPLASSSTGEIAIKRSLLDQLLLQHAAELGAEVFQNHAVKKIAPGWMIEAGDQSFHARTLVAADGRNSSVARLLGLLPSSTRERIGLQTHLAAPKDFGDRVVLQFLKDGYCGLASVGEEQLNLCLVARPAQIEALKGWAAARFGLPPEQSWRTITPLARAPAFPLGSQLLLVGDAARVVEPFTGEGIYYALASGELAARHIISGDLASYPEAHRALYRGRLWINQLAKYAVTHPNAATALLRASRFAPGLMSYLTRKVVR